MARLLDDTGALGLLELTNVNFMTSCRQGAIRVRASQRQELVRFEFWIRAIRVWHQTVFPLAMSVQYLRDFHHHAFLSLDDRSRGTSASSTPGC